MQKRATITSKGQITVPRDVRRMLGVRSGDKLLFESDGKGVRIRPIKNRSAFSGRIASSKTAIGRVRRGDAMSPRTLRAGLGNSENLKTMRLGGHGERMVVRGHN